jgi:hypothetical protein
MSDSKHKKSQDSIVSELKAYEMRVSSDQSAIDPDQKLENTLTENGANPNSRLHVSRRGYVSNIDTTAND